MAIVVPIDADVSGLTRKLGTASSSLGGFGRVAAYVAGAAALGGLVATMKVGIDEFRASELVTAQTGAVLKSTGNAANLTAKQISDLASKLERKSMMDDEAIQSGENLLLTFTRIRNETGKGNDIFTQATQAMVDVSQAMGIDASTAAIQLGKALNDPVRGVGQLRKVGVSFTEEQRDQIKTLVESGNVMGAQKMILRELAGEFGGSALAASKTLDGQLTILKNTFNNIAGDLVASFMPDVARAAQSLVDFVTGLQARPTFSAKVEFTIGKLKDLAGGAYDSLIHWWNTSQTKELPARVVLTPAGKDQVAIWAADLKKKLDESVDRIGYEVGKTLASALFSGAKQGANENGAGVGSSIIRSLFVNPVAIDLGKRLGLAVYRGVAEVFSQHSLTELIGAWIRGAAAVLPGTLLPGTGQALWDGIKQQVDRATRRNNGGGLLDRSTIAKIITADMKSAIQSARGGLAGAASGLAGMLNQIVAARGTNPTADLAAARALEDRRLLMQEDGLKAALAATEDGSAEQAKAQLDLDQFYFDKKATLRQRDVEDEQKKNQSAIEDLAARFNKGLIDANAFNAGLDALIGGEAGTSLGDAFSLGFTNAIQSLKNMALDIASIVGTSNPLGPEVGAGGGPVAAAALQAYNDALSKWQDRQDALAKKVRDLRDKANDDKSPGGKAITAAEKAAIDKAIDARDAHKASRPNKKDYGFALGGILTGPRVIAGEAGNEAVIPLGSPTAAQMMRKAFSEAVNGSGDTVYNISITAGMGADGSDIGRQIVEAIKVFERRNGPVFAGA